MGGGSCWEEEVVEVVGLLAGLGWGVGDFNGGTNTLVEYLLINAHMEWI